MIDPEAYPHLANLNKTEMKGLVSIVTNHGVQGLLHVVRELALFNQNREKPLPPDQRALASRLALEMAAVIERLEGNRSSDN